MTPFLGWLTRVREKLLGSYYEGPSPPDRFQRMAEAFADMRRDATRAEWVAFSAHLAGEAYKSGYLRGFQWAERQEPETRVPDPSPEVVADAIDPDWRWRPMSEVVGPDEPVLDERPRADGLVQEMARARRAGTV